MPRALPNEIRERVIAAREQEGLTIDEVAARFMVGTATVKRWERRKKTTGSLSPSAMGGARRTWFGPDEREALVALVRSMPDSTIEEYRVAYNEKFGAEVSDSSMHRALQRFELTRKKRR